MRTITFLFFCHCGAMVLGLVGLLVMLPHPEIWDGTSSGVAVFTFNMTYTGSLYILLGAATMLLFGLRFLGARRTLIFFCASTLISLSMELLGTSTGFPFGPYAYTNLLGFKILGHVPYSIPLSWFYMGFTSYILASILVARTGWRYKTLWSLLLGAALLTVWDLALDPAMASQNLPVQFWKWNEPGPYFGMPISNLIGWSVTGLLFMSVSCLLWRRNVEISSLKTWLPFGVYAANTCFAIVLTLGAGIWLPSLMALLLGLLPATFAFRSAPRKHGQRGYDSERVAGRISHLVVQRGSSSIVKRQFTNEVSGLEYLSRQGPVLIVARHFHHLYDGCLLLQVVPRRLHLLVALDWITRPLMRCAMEGLCRAVAWPVVLRDERLRAAETGGGASASAYRLSEARGYLRRASALALQLLRQGEVLVIFPEAYPTIDPLPSPKQGDEDFLPFRPGFARLLELAEKDGQTRVAVVPAGLHYVQRERWHATLRFGPALWRQDFATTEQFVQAVEERVHVLSSAAAPLPAHPSVQEAHQR